MFGEDLYIEIMRHGQEDEKRANEVLISLSHGHDRNRNFGGCYELLPTQKIGFK